MRRSDTRPHCTSVSNIWMVYGGAISSMYFTSDIFELIYFDGKNNIYHENDYEKNAIIHFWVLCLFDNENCLSISCPLAFMLSVMFWLFKNHERDDFHFSYRRYFAIFNAAVCDDINISKEVCASKPRKVYSSYLSFWVFLLLLIGWNAIPNKDDVIDINDTRWITFRFLTQLFGNIRCRIFSRLRVHDKAYFLLSNKWVEVHARVVSKYK